MNRLTELRKEYGFTQKKLAQKLNITQTGYAPYEAGRSLPIDILIRLAEIYETSTDYILGLTDEIEPYK